MTEVGYDNEKEFNETIDKFEPMLAFPMSANDMESLKATAIVSIAISLKRIADKLEIANKQPIVMSSKEYEAYMNIMNMKSKS
jgi:hypothetical protein